MVIGGSKKILGDDMRKPKVEVDDKLICFSCGEIKSKDKQYWGYQDCPPTPTSGGSDNHFWVTGKKLRLLLEKLSEET